MTPAAGAEILLLGILAGFFVSRVMERFAGERNGALSDEAREQLEQVVEAALAKRLAEGGVAMAAPAATATAVPTEVDTDAETATAEAATDTETVEETAEADAPGVPEGEVVTMKVTTIDGETHTLEVNAGENMLDAALDRDVDLDYSCKDGGCDTCTVKILSGMEFLEPIFDEERDMLDEDELASGHRLSCLIHVRGPVELIQEER